MATLTLSSSQLGPCRMGASVGPKQLRFNSYSSCLSQSLQTLLAQSYCTDVIISTGHESPIIPAHKLILSAFSPYFKSLFDSVSTGHFPVVIIRDISYDTLLAIVQICYQGEIQIPSDKVQDVIEAAKFLKVGGIDGFDIVDSGNPVPTEGSRSESSDEHGSAASLPPPVTTNQNSHVPPVSPYSPLSSTNLAAAPADSQPINLKLNSDSGPRSPESELAKRRQIRKKKRFLLKKRFRADSMENLCEKETINGNHQRDESNSGSTSLDKVDKNSPLPINLQTNQSDNNNNSYKLDYSLKELLQSKTAPKESKVFQDSLEINYSDKPAAAISDGSEDEIIEVDDVPTSKSQGEEIDLSLKSKLDYFDPVHLSSVIRHTAKQFIANDKDDPLQGLPPKDSLSFLNEDHELLGSVEARMQIMSQLMQNSTARAMATFAAKPDPPAKSPLDESFFHPGGDSVLPGASPAATFPFNSSLFAAAAAAAAAVAANHSPGASQTSPTGPSEKRGRGRPPKYGSVHQNSPNSNSFLASSLKSNSASSISASLPSLGSSVKVSSTSSPPGATSNSPPGIPDLTTSPAQPASDTGPVIISRSRRGRPPSMPEDVVRNLTGRSEKVHHKCPHCPQIYYGYHAMRDHITSVHLNSGNKYICHLCNKEYTWRITLRKHLKFQHNVHPDQV